MIGWNEMEVNDFVSIGNVASPDESSAAVNVLPLATQTTGLESLGAYTDGSA